MVEKKKDSEQPPQQPQDIGQQILGDVAQILEDEDWTMKAPDENIPDFAGIGKTAAGEYAEKGAGDVNKVVTSDAMRGALEKESKNQEAGAIKIARGAVETVRSAEEVEDAGGAVNKTVNRREFVKWTLAGAIAGFFSSLVSYVEGWTKVLGIGSGPSGGFLDEFRVGYREGLEGGRIVKGRVFDSGSLWQGCGDAEEDVKDYDYFLQIGKDPSTLDNATPDVLLVLLSSRETYRTPDGLKDGRLIAEYFSKDPTKRRYDLIKIRYLSQVSCRKYYSGTALTLGEVLGWKTGSSYYYDKE